MLARTYSQPLTFGLYKRDLTNIQRPWLQVPQSFEVVAHRGFFLPKVREDSPYTVYPEGVAEAHEQAAKAGLSTEMDGQAPVSGAPVSHHDNFLGRVWDGR